MLLDLRETVRNSKPIKYTLITIIVIPFAIVGVGSYLTGGQAPPVAEVNGEPINGQQLERAYQQQRQQLARMFGGQLPEAFANEEVLRQQALQQLISQQVLENEVVNQNFAVGDKTLGRAIRNLPAFQVDGRFDSDAYQNQLRASGMSVAAFEQSYRDDTALNQFRTGVSDTSFTLPSEVARLASLAQQTRTIDAVQFDFEKTKESIELTAEEIQAYFEEKQDNYQFPQRAKIQYLELSSSIIADGIDVSEDQAREYYDNNRSSYMLPEQREASHILLSSDEGKEADQLKQVADIKARIEAGEAFADLAKELSDDVGSAELGGSLGIISSGAMVPEFESAVFALEAEGALSEPVVTEFGVHLIRLDSIVPESGKPFDDVRDDVIATLKKDEADSDYFEIYEQLAELSFDNPGSLEPASDATGIEVQISDWLDADADAGPVLSNPQLIRAVFSDDVLLEENNSELIEVGDRFVVVLRVLEHEEPRPKTIDDVREELVSTLKGEKATELLKEKQSEALARLKEGEAATAIADADDLATALEKEALDRQSSTIDRSVTTRVFSLAQPGDIIITDAVTLSTGDLMALRLEAVNTPVVDPAAGSTVASAAVPTAGANPSLGGIEFQAMLENLTQKADVDIKATASP